MIRYDKVIDENGGLFYHMTAAHLSQPLNIAYSISVTRAKSGLLVVGDSSTLRYDRHWRAFVDWCRKEGCYISQTMSAETIAKLYTDMEPARRLDPPRRDDRMTREGRINIGGPPKMWKPTRSMTEEVVQDSGDLQESAVEGMQK